MSILLFGGAAIFGWTAPTLLMQISHLPWYFPGLFAGSSVATENAPELNLSDPDSSFKVEIWRRKSIFRI